MRLNNSQRRKGKGSGLVFVSPSTPFEHKDNDFCMVLGGKEKHSTQLMSEAFCSTQRDHSTSYTDKMLISKFTT